MHVVQSDTFGRLAIAFPQGGLVRDGHVQKDEHAFGECLFSVVHLWLHSEKKKKRKEKQAGVYYWLCRI